MDKMQFTENTDNGWLQKFKIGAIWIHNAHHDKGES